ncbi:MAG: haloacid dehalogenase-like hydrolase [Endomicrobiaceae bacterium]|nr:haloacid dehalogenase-like hydrolase [Endomicrobiaceae bacterium]
MAQFKKKLFVCGVDGTLFTPNKIEDTDISSNCWQSIARILGEGAIEEEKKNHKKWQNSEFENYTEWVQASYCMHKKYGLKKEQFDAVIDNIFYNNGVEDFFKKLDRTKWEPVVISGGFQNLIHKAEEDLDITRGYGACEYKFDKAGYLDKLHELHPSDFKGKIDFLKIIIKNLKLNIKTDWVFVGDDKNDIEIAKIAPLSFCINPHKDLKNIKNIIEIKSFMDILPYINDVEKYIQPYEHITEQDDKINKLNLKIQYFEKIIRNYSKEHEIEKRNNRIAELETKNNKLAQENNDLKGRISKFDIEKLKIHESFYTKIPKKSLQDITSKSKIAIIGFNEGMAVFSQLSNIENLTVISADDTNFNLAKVKKLDFLFLAIDHLAHSVGWRATNNIDKKTKVFNLIGRNPDQIKTAIANTICESDDNN